jgi:hypothetical protein
MTAERLVLLLLIVCGLRFLLFLVAALLTIRHGAPP